MASKQIVNQKFVQLVFLLSLEFSTLQWPHRRHHRYWLMNFLFFLLHNKIFFGLKSYLSFPNQLFGSNLSSNISKVLYLHKTYQIACRTGKIARLIFVDIVHEFNHVRKIPFNVSFSPNLLIEMKCNQSVMVVTTTYYCEIQSMSLMWFILLDFFPYTTHE